jgi:hypothetical protein
MYRSLIVLAASLLILSAPVSFGATKMKAAKKPTAKAVVKNSTSLAGDWNGALNAGGVELRLVFHVKKGAKGALAGTMDSIDQGAKGIPIASAEQKGKSVSLMVSAIGGSYAGTMNAKGSEISGKWSQGGQSLPMTLKRGDIKPAMTTLKPGQKRSSPLEGDWAGTLNAGPANYRLLFHFALQKNGEFAGSLDSLDQGAKGIPASDIQLSGSALSLKVKGIGGAYEGKLNKEKAEIAGIWSQSGMTFPLNLKRTK